MSAARTFALAGGGTGGHVIPALAVARELRLRGHEPFFIGTRRGMEARLVPPAGFPIEWIEIGGLKGVGPWKALRTLWQLPAGVLRALRLLRRRHAAALFSMGGYVAGPVMLAAWIARIPIVVMEPNAMPGFTSRSMGRVIARALVSFPESVPYFRRGRTELTGLPVRDAFFRIPPSPRGGTLTVLVTGGSQGSRTLNRAVAESWPLFRDAGFPIRFLHQTGPAPQPEIPGFSGTIMSFIDDMPAAFAEADLVVCRSGAGAVAELAAAGKPAILVPFPFAADQHQLRNAEALARAGAARLVLDVEMNGHRLFKEVTALASEPGLLQRMGEAARSLAHAGAAHRAAEILEEVAGGSMPPARSSLPLTSNDKAETIQKRNVL
jgi:UDP-N-acetylglucosamine--N-acetylmuramyl-(pentapeptide) pyrophosphoryl-undecaprenol N-acetylglucosamine transferase